MESIKIGKAELKLIQGDITQQQTEAIANAANSSLMGGGGVDGAIHRAGGAIILEECKKIVARQGCLPTGEAVITTACAMPSKYVIHTVGPVWHGGDKNEAELLSNCYRNSLTLAKEKGIKTISFPSISTGVYSYPTDQAAQVALQAVSDFLKVEESFVQVVFVLYDNRTYESYVEALRRL